MVRTQACELRWKGCSEAKVKTQACDDLRRGGEVVVCFTVV